MDLITVTWITSTPSGSAWILFVAIPFVGVAGILVLISTLTSTNRKRKPAGIATAVAAAAVLAILIPAAMLQPRIDVPASDTYIEASGTIDSITHDLNRGGTGIRLTDSPEILLAISENEADQFAGLEGHPTTLYCKIPGDVDRDEPALAAGTILDCSSNESRGPLREIFPPAEPDSVRDAATPITTTDGGSR